MYLCKTVHIARIEEARNAYRILVWIAVAYKTNEEMGTYLKHRWIIGRQVQGPGSELFPASDLL
jgi:hypothetical protein